MLAGVKASLPHFPFIIERISFEYNNSERDRLIKDNLHGQTGNIEKQKKAFEVYVFAAYKVKDNTLNFKQLEI